MKKYFLKNEGLATIELLIAFAILIIYITGVVILLSNNQTTALQTELAQQALRIAQSKMETLKHDAKIDFNTLNPDTIESGLYTIDLQVSSLPESLFLKRIKSIVSWDTPFHDNNTVELITDIANINALDGGDTCSSILLGDWSHPIKSEYQLGADILNDTSSGFPILGIQTFNEKMYLALGNGNSNTTNTFLRLDISNSDTAPIFIPPGLDNNPAVSSGLNALAIDGKKYAYVASAHPANFESCTNSDGNNKSCGQLQVIDLDTFNVVYTYKIPGVTGSAGQGIGVSILYNNGIVFLGLAKAIGAEFHVIDVGGGSTPGASPTHPIDIGSYEVGNEVNEMYLKNNYLFLASPNDQELKILNISNLNNPILVGGFDAPLGGANNGNGKSVFLVGNTLYFGRTLLTGNEFYILNASNPETNLPILGTKNIQNGTSNTSVNKILPRDYLTMLVTNKEFQILRTDDPVNITSYASPMILPPGSSTGMQAVAADCEGNNIFIGSQDSTNVGFITKISSS